MAIKFKDYYDGVCAELIGRQPHFIFVYYNFPSSNTY